MHLSGRPALSRGARVFPWGAPGVAVTATSGRSGAWRCPGVRPSTRGVVRQRYPERGDEAKKNVRFLMVFGLFLLTFACCVVLVILPFLVRFFQIPTPEVPPPRAAPGAALPEVRPHLGRPGVSPCPG